jgi:DNA-binding helix-hairpin-helix protein with protein kinase domain
MQYQRLSDARKVVCKKELGSGGEAIIYEVENEAGVVAKVYRKPTQARLAKLQAMLANPPEDPMAKHGLISIAWPVDILYQWGGANFVGFLMPRVSQMRPICDFYTPKIRKQKCPLFHYQYLHHAAYNLATVVAALHAAGYVIGDVNESNFLIGSNALIAVVDTDSFQVPDTKNGKIYRCPVGKPEFTPPELQNKVFADIDRQASHDLFGLAVLIFQLLMEGTHPFAGVFKGKDDPPPNEERISSGHFPYSRKRNVPYSPPLSSPPLDILSPHVRELFIQCFENGHSQPSKRPQARVWQKGIKMAEAGLVTCARNEQHRYGHHLAGCPWCERAHKLGGRDPFPAKKMHKATPQRLASVAAKKPAGSSQPVAKPAVSAGGSQAAARPLKFSASPPAAAPQGRWGTPLFIMIVFALCYVWYRYEERANERWILRRDQDNARFQRSLDEQMRKTRQSEGNRRPQEDIEKTKKWIQEEEAQKQKQQEEHRKLTEKKEKPKKQVEEEPKQEEEQELQRIKNDPKFKRFAAKQEQRKQVEASSDGRYRKSSAGVILDTRTNLEWYVGPDEDTKWYQTKKWVANLHVDGGGWRLPSVGELRGLYQQGKGLCNIDPMFVVSGWLVWFYEDEVYSSVRCFDFGTGDVVLSVRGEPDFRRGFAVRVRK